MRLPFNMLNFKLYHVITVMIKKRLNFKLSCTMTGNLSLHIMTYFIMLHRCMYKQLYQKLLIWHIVEVDYGIVFTVNRGAHDSNTRLCISSQSYKHTNLSDYYAIVVIWITVNTGSWGISSDLQISSLRAWLHVNCPRRWNSCRSVYTIGVLP